MLTNHQKEVIHLVVKSIRNGKSCCLTGRAGTGKSYCLGDILDEIHLKTICASPTHSAAMVFREYTGRNCCTVASLLKKRKEINYETGEVLFDPNVGITNSKFLIVIDESSMIGEADYNTLNTNFPNCIFLYVGDPGQLPPVKENEFSVFDKFPCYTLLINMRCGEGNPMFDLIEKVYNTELIDKTFFDRIHLSNNVCAIDSNQIESNDLVITYTNEKRRYFNNWVLNNYWKGQISKNTKFIANENIGYDKKSRQYLFTNGESFFPEQVSKDTYLIHKAGINFEYYTLKVKGKYVNFVLDRTKLDNYLDKLKREKLWKEYFSYVEIFPNINLGYAITSHTSQGQTFKEVVIDVNNILGVFEPRVRKASLYVALSRASDCISLII